MKQKVVIDLDDTLNNLAHILYVAMAIETKKIIPVYKWHDYNISIPELYNLDGGRQELLDIIKTNDLLNMCNPSKFCQITYMFKLKGYEVIIATARKCFKDKKIREKTEAWLKKHSYQIYYDKLLITDVGNKLDGIKGVDYFIDDNKENLEPYKNDVRCLLVDQPWNQGGDLIRVKTVSDIVSKL
jgi:5'(3')-deoxyribonucleotidase